jgi:LysM repeat protein
MRFRGALGRAARATALALVTAAALAAPAAASVPHVVQTGESLGSVAAANGLSTASLASFNGLSEDDWLYEGQTIQVPSADEAAVAAPSTDTTTATSSASHVVQTGESLGSVAAANGLSTASLASFNGLSENDWLYEGQTIQIPSASGVAAPSTDSSSSTTTTAAPASTPASGMATISGPLGSVQLDPTAASQWEAMRSAALTNYGVDLYPAGSLSGYRTYDQQAYLYNLFLSGEGAPANPPGTSSHELGIAVDMPDPAMRDVVDAIGASYGWYGIQSEWWHVEYWG